MNYIAFLGKIASIARSIGLGRFLDYCRDRADHLWMRRGYLPLKVEVEGVIVGGFLRHRSFLDNLQRTYEPFSRHLFKASLKPGTVVVDGGAHIGLYSLIASRTLGDKGRVLAFEPDPYNFHALLLNLWANGCRNVIAVPKALSSSAGKAWFYQSAGTISSSLIRRHEFDTHPVRLIEVETTTLDQEMRDLKAEAILVKLDLEGAEPLAVDGMAATVKRASSVTVIVEMNPSALAAAGFTPKALVHKLQRLELEVFFIDEGTRSLIPVEDLSEWRKGNLLGRKGRDGRETGF